MLYRWAQQISSMAVGTTFSVAKKFPIVEDLRITNKNVYFLLHWLKRAGRGHNCDISSL